MQTKKFYHYKNSNTTRADKFDEIIWSIFEGRDKNLWVGTYSGLKIFDRSIHAFKEPGLKINSFSSHNISKLFEDSRGNLWIGTWGGGLYRYNKSKNKTSLYLQNKSDNSSIDNNLITTIYEDSRKNLLIGTNAGGLNLYKYDEDKFYHFIYNPGDVNSISNNNVTCIFEDDKNRLWIGTWGGGLNMTDFEMKSFKHFTEKEGLSNNILYGILPDDNNNLWISTGSGLSRFNLNTFKFINYDAKDGLGNSQFSQGYFRCTNGNMIFGGTNGITMFNPDSIKINKNIPSVVLTSFTVFDKKRKPKNNISGTGSIILDYHEHDFAIEFSALDFIRPDKNRYAYKLEGYSTHWTYSGNRRKAYFTNMEPGRYILKVKASNGNNIWSKETALLKIKIVPPFWKTWPFISLALLLLISAVYLIHRYRLEQLLKFERIRNTIAVDLHDDIGASLTRISLFSHAALRSLKKIDKDYNEYDPINRVKKLLMEIDDNSRELISSMSDIIWAVNPKNDSFDKVTIRMKDYAVKIFEANEVDYNIFIEPRLSYLHLPMDFRRNIFMIYKESITNIIKHANASEVEIKLFKDKENVVLSIKDNGKGFFVGNGSNGNGLKNIESRAAALNGCCKINSEPEGGTILLISLKLP